MPVSRKRLEALTDPGRVARAVRARTGRASAYVATRRRWQGFPAERRRGTFVVGCQRSGTSMLVENLSLAPEVWAYSEAPSSPAFRHFRLREADRVEALIRRGPAPITAFKPICDSHLTDVLLDQHYGSTALWIWRDHRDVARSGITRWGDHQLDIIASLRAGRFADLGWRGERVDDDQLAVLRRLPLAGPADGAALVWWLRNSFLFQLGLDGDRRVHVVSYDDLVRAPTPTLTAVFAHLGIELPSTAASEVRRSDRVPAPLEGLSPEVGELCEEMAGRLRAATSELAVDG